MTRTVLVTGSEGFLGQHVVTALGQSSILEIVRHRRSLAPLAREGRTTVVGADLLERDGVAAVARFNPDVVVHLAWDGLSDFRSEQHLDQVAAHMRLLEALVAVGVKRIVAVGTCFEYGLVEGELDEATPTRPVIAYAEGKVRLLEQLERLATGAGVSWCWARIFYPYGPGQQPRSLWSSLQAAIDRGDHEFPMSGGEQVRDYLHVSQVGRVLAALAPNESATGPINVCSGEPVKVRELVERWIAERGSSIRARLGVYPYPDYEPMSFWGSTRALAAALATLSVVPDCRGTRLGEEC